MSKLRGSSTKSPSSPQKSSAENTDVIPLRVPKHGNGKLRLGGKPGNKGGTGRPPMEFKAWCAALLDRSDNRQAVEEILANHAHPAYATMWKAVSDRAHGKPQQTVEHKGTLNLMVDI